MTERLGSRKRLAAAEALVVSDVIPGQGDHWLLLEGEPSVPLRMESRLPLSVPVGEPPAVTVATEPVSATVVSAEPKASAASAKAAPVAAESAGAVGAATAEAGMVAMAGAALPVSAATLGVLGLGVLGVAAAAGGGGGSSGGSSTPPAPAPDTAAPSAPVITANQANTLISAAEKAAGITLSGTAEANATVTVVWSGKTKTATATNGNWSVLFAAVDVPADGNTTLTATATDAAGNVSSQATQSLTIDTIAPTVSPQMTVNGAAKTVTLTYDGALDAANPPPPTAFTVTTVNQANPVVSVTVSGSTVTLLLTNTFGAGSVSVAYTDPSAGDDANAIQDAAGNDAETFSTLVVADGYVRGASLYVDFNDDGVVDAGDVLVGQTDARGNVLIPASAPSGALLAVGGVNIDTGVPNTLVLRAPAGSSSINPLTTLVQQLVLDAGGTLDTATAAAAIVAKLNLTLPDGASLLDYDPLAAGDVGVQKIAAQIATLSAGASSGDSALAQTVFANLATLILDAGENATIDLADVTTLGTLLDGVVADATLLNDLATAAAALSLATDFDVITQTQAMLLDKIAPAAPALGVAELTNDNTPTVRVSFETGATNGSAVVVGNTITLLEGTTVLATGVVTLVDMALGYRDLSVAAPLPDGPHNLTAKTTDLANNPSDVATEVTVTIDTLPPAGSLDSSIGTDSGLVGSIASGQSTRDNTLTLTGVTEAGATVVVRDGSQTLGAASVDGTVWTFTTGALADGSRTFTAVITDAAGNAFTTSAVTAVIDTTVSPATLSSTIGTNGGVVGTIETGGATRDTTLALSGTAEPGSTVQVYDADTLLGTAMLSGTAWTYVTDALLAGEHSFTAQITDLVGNQITTSLEVTATIDLEVSLATLELSAFTDGGNAASVDDGGRTRDNTLQLTGQAEAGSVVTVFDGDTTLGVATLDDTSWSYTTPVRADGARVFSISVTDSVGNTLAPDSTLTITVDTQPPQGVSINTIATDDKIVQPERADGVRISVQATGAQTVTIDFGGLSRDAALDDGVWVADFSSEEIPADGTVTVSVQAVDDVGNVATATRSVVIDTTADTPTVSSDTTVNYAQLEAGLTVSGTASPGTINLYRAGEGTPLKTVDVASGAWSVTLGLEDISSDGAHDFEVELVDADGNPSARVSHQITADVTLPSSPSISVAAAEDGYLNLADAQAGIVLEASAEDATALTFRLALASAPGVVIATKTASGSGGVWQATITDEDLGDDGEYVITAVAADAAGNQAEASANYQVDLTPPGEASILDITDDHVVNFDEKTNGARVSVSVQDATGVTITFGTTEREAAQEGDNWVADFAGDDIPADGSAEVRVVATDVAGNQATTERDVEVDTEIAVPTVTGDTLINVAELPAAQLSGTAPGAEIVRLYRAGESDPLVSDDEVTAGNWSVPIQAWLNEGENAFELAAVDAAGNVSERVAYNVTLDTVPPDAPGLDTVAEDNFITLIEKTAGVVISGTAEAGASVQVNFAGVTQTVEAAEDSTWSVTYTAANLPADGLERTLTITATDDAGNTSTPTVVSIGIDTTPPAQPTLNVVAGDDKVNAAEIELGVLTLSGTGPAGSVISITLNGVERNDIGVDDNGNWTADYGAGDLPTGDTQLVSVKALDEYQNESAAVTRSVIFDSTTPSLQTATINGSTLTLTYDEPLDATRQAKVASYLVTVNDQGRTVTQLAVSGATALLTLSTPVATGDAVKLSYLDLEGDDAHATQDVLGNDAAGLSDFTVTNQTSASGTDTTAPRLVSGEIAGNVLTLQFNENMQVAASGTLPSLLRNGEAGVLVSQTSRSVSGKTITFNLGATLDASEFLLVSNPATSRVKDTAGNALAQGNYVIGTAGNDALDFAGRTDFSKGVHIRANDGDDTLRGTYLDDVLIGGAGADTLRGYAKADSFFLTEASPAMDTLFIGADEESTADAYDVVFGFDTLNTDNTDNTDRLALPGGDVAANSDGWVDGTNQGGLNSHLIANGMVSFGSTDAGTPVLINAGNLASALDYLAHNITTRGQTVGFEVDTDSNGAVDSTCIFQAQEDSLNDVVVMLRGVVGASLANTGGTNKINIYDGVGPTQTDVNLGSDTLTLFFDEAVSSLALDSFEVTRYGNAGSEALSISVEVSGTQAVLNLGTTLVLGDYLLLRSNTPSQLLAYDASGNHNELFTPPISGAAIGGEGDKVIDISGQTGRIDIFDLGGGDDEITGSAEYNLIFGGAGADRYNGSAGDDTYTVQQGDTTAVTYTDVGSNGLGSNDTFTFSGGAEVFSGLFSGDTLALENAGTQGALVRETLGSSGLVGDQKFATVSGVWNDGNDTFTFGSAGTDTLVLFDGDGNSTTPLQHALVLEGVNASEFSVQNNQIVIV